MRRVIILGSTGSIGTQAIEVVNQHRDRFEVVGLAAGTNKVESAGSKGASTVASAAKGLKK